MSVPADQLNNLRPLSASLSRLNEERPAQAVAANEERAHIAEDLLPQTVPQTDLRRTEFVAVSNLHQGDGLRNQFARVPLSQEQIKEDLGEALYDLFEFQQPVATAADEEAKARGGQISREATNRLHVPEALTKDKLKHDYKFQSDAYKALHKELNKSDAVQEERGKRSLVEKFKHFFVGNARDRLDISVEGRGDPNGDKVNVKLSIDGKAITNEAALHHRADYTDKSGISWRKAAYGLGMGVLVAGGIGAIVVVGGLLATVGGGLAIAGGVYMAGKLAVGKHPWWGKTVTGQLQKAERAHARVLADGIAEQVKATMKIDAGNRNVEGKFEARHIMKDAEALQNFIRLAKDKNASRLYNDIRAKLLEEASSPLSSDTITRAKTAAPKWKVWAYLFKGAPGKHANKTVDIYAKELTMGIMRGVNEAYVQSLIGELSDHVSNQGQARLVQILAEDGNGGNGLMARATDALKFLNPDNNADRFPIAQPEEHIAALQAMLGDQVVGPEAGTIDRAITLVNESRDVLGELNTQNLSTALGTLKSDIEKHIASLQDVNQLLSKRGEDVVSLDTINDKLAALLADGFDSEQEAKAATQALDDELGQLLARVNDANDADAQRLVKAHAEQLVDLLAEVRTAIKDAGEHAAITAGAEAAFRSDDLTLDQFRTEASRLRALNDKRMADLDPSGRGKDVIDAMAKAQQQRETLLKHCATLDEAGKRAAEIKSIRDEAVAMAAEGELQGALQRQTEVDDRHRDYQNLTRQWTDASFVLPGDLSAIDVAQWKREVTAAYLKLDAPTADLAPVLDKLVAGDPAAMAALRLLSEENGSAAVKNLLADLQQTLPAPGADAPTAAQQAITALRVLDKAMVDEAGNAAAIVAKALHPAQANLIGTYRAVEALDKASRTAMQTIGTELEQINAEAADGQRVDSGDAAARFLQHLAQFCANHPGALAPDDLATLQAVAARFADGETEFAAWGAEAPRIAAFDRDQVGKLLAIFNGLNADNDPLRTAINQQNEFRLARLAVAKKLAAEIAEGAQNAESPALQAAVQLAAAPRAGVSREELEAVAKQLLEAYVAQSSNASGQRLTEADLKIIATQLGAQLGFKGTPEELIKRIGDQPAVQRLLRRHITANLELRQVAQQALPPLAAAMTDTERMGSARTLAGFAPARSSALDELSAAGKGAVRARVEARDKLSARLRKSDTEQLGDKQLARKLRNKQTQEAVERFALEERVFGFLKAATGTAATLKEIRIAVEESGAAVENATANLALLRQQAINHASHITGYIERGIRARLSAIQELVDSGLYDAIPLQDQDGSWDPRLAYLGTEIVRLQKQLNSLDQVAEALQRPAERDLAAVGRMIREADAVDGQSQESIKLAYINAQQHETAQALKYFNIQNFSVQSPGWGFLGQLYFRLFNQNEVKLSRVAGREDARAIADSISLIAEKNGVSSSLSIKQKQLEQAIAELEARKQAMVNNESTVRSALVLVTLEHLAASDGEKITDSLREAIINDWKALLGNEADKHADLIFKVGKFENLETLVKSLGVQQGVNDKIGREYEAVRAQQRELESTGKKLRDAISASALEVARKHQAETLEKAQELGLDEADFVALTSLVGDSAARFVVDNFQVATECRDRNAYAEAWARASDAVMKMEATVVYNSRDASAADLKRNKDIALRLIGKLEKELLESFPDGATPLDSTIRVGSPAERGMTLDSQGRSLVASAKDLSVRDSRLKSEADKVAEIKDKKLRAAAEETLKAERKVFGERVKAYAEKVKTFEENVKQALENTDLQNGMITDTRQLSRRALQRLGVETQLHLAVALSGLSRYTKPADGDTSFESRAKYHSYNAGLIGRALESRPANGATENVSTYAKSLEDLDTELKYWFGASADKLTVAELEKLKDQARDALNMTVDEGMQDNREMMKANTQLTSAVIEPSVPEEKQNMLSRILGRKKK